jgi:hypothetical protein
MDYHPARHVKLLVFLPVSGHISLELLPPPLAVVLREDAMLGARMPETTIHENRYPSQSERKIWATGQQCKIYSISKTTVMQLVTYKHFRCSRGPTHLLHLRRNCLIQGGGPFSSRMISQISAFLSPRALYIKRSHKPTASYPIPISPSCCIATSRLETFIIL